jgi:hypothetical protein
VLPEVLDAQSRSSVSGVRHRLLVYLLRVAAFIVIAFAIARKNSSR